MTKTGVGNLLSNAPGRGRTIRILVYSGRNDQWVANMQSWLEENWEKGGMHLCRTPEELREGLLSTPAGKGIAVLRVQEEGELKELAALRRQLMRLRVVLVHSGLEDRLHGSLYSFHPRFIGHEEQDLLPFYQVLARMMETSGQ